METAGRGIVGKPAGVYGSRQSGKVWMPKRPFVGLKHGAVWLFGERKEKQVFSPNKTDISNFHYHSLM